MRFATLHWQSIWEEANAVQASGMEYYSLATFVFDRVEAACPEIQVAKQRSQIEAWAHAFHRDFLKIWIKPHWGMVDIRDVRTVAVENWLRKLHRKDGKPLSNSSKAR